MTGSDTKDEDNNKRMMFLEGLVKQRNATQDLLFRLLKFVRDGRHKDALSKEEMNAAFQLTVGATFSLWRAIGLAGEPFEPRAALNAAEELLDRVVASTLFCFLMKRQPNNGWAATMWQIFSFAYGGYHPLSLQLATWMNW
jgi:hypothetical protein